MKVIPAIDLIGGRLVRLEKGDYSKEKGYGLVPLDAAKRFEDGGLTSLHLVDLDGAKGQGRNLDVLEKIACNTSLSIDFGGGIRKEEDVRRALDAGASAVNVGSMAVKDGKEVRRWASLFPRRIILSADVRGRSIAVSGWSEDTSIDIVSFLSSYLLSGIDIATVTDIDRDGMLSGPSIGLYKELLSSLPALRLIASGGVSSKEDLLALRDAGCHGAIVGKAYYEGRITISDMKEAEC